MDWKSRLESYRLLKMRADCRLYRAEYFEQYNRNDPFSKELRAEAKEFYKEMTKIKKVVNNLPEPYRSVLIFHYIDGLTLENISERLYYSFRWTQRLKKKALEFLERANTQ